MAVLIYSKVFIRYHLCATVCVDAGDIMVRMVPSFKERMPSRDEMKLNTVVVKLNRDYLRGTSSQSSLRGLGKASWKR